jgi:hypothetical protein
MHQITLARFWLNADSIFIVLNNIHAIILCYVRILVGFIEGGTRCLYFKVPIQKKKFIKGF